MSSAPDLSTFLAKLQELSELSDSLGEYSALRDSLRDSSTAQGSGQSQQASSKDNKEKSEPPRQDGPERTRYVEVSQPTGWQTMSKAVREVDEDKVEDCKDDIDTLLVFLS